MDGPFIDFGSQSRLQRSDLNDRTLHQDEIQLPEVTDPEVVGVEDFELLRPVGLKEDQLHQDADHGAQQEAGVDRFDVAYDGDFLCQADWGQDPNLWDQEDYLRGVQGGVDCQEEEQLPHLEEVHTAETRREPEV